MTAAVKEEILTDHLEHFPTLVSLFDATSEFSFRFLCGVTQMANPISDTPVVYIANPNFMEMYTEYKLSLPMTLRTDTIDLVVFFIISIACWLKMDESEDEPSYGEYSYRTYSGGYPERMKAWLLDPATPTCWPVLHELRKAAGAQDSGDESA